VKVIFIAWQLQQQLAAWLLHTKAESEGRDIYMTSHNRSLHETSLRGKNILNRTITVGLLAILALFLFDCDSQPRESVNSGSVKNRNPYAGDSQSKEVLERYHGHDVAANQVLVKFRHPDQWQDKNTLETFAAKVTEDNVSAEPVGNGDVALVRSRTGRSVQALKDSFDDEKYAAIVKYAEPDYVVALDCKDPCSAQNEYLGKQWGLDKIKACDAWQQVDGCQDKSERPMVAVIDSGIDCTFKDPNIKCHEDLDGNIWLPPDGFSVRLGARDVKCSKGCFGFDATIDDSECDDKKWFPSSKDGHATQVSGIIAARNNDRGVVGVSFESQVLIVKYTTVLGHGFASSVKRAIDFVIAASEQKNIRVVNCSFGFTPSEVPDPADSQTLRAAFDLLNQTNLLIVTSASNDGGSRACADRPNFPSSYDLSNLIAVTSTDPDDHLVACGFDSRSSNLIGAPGIRIFTTQQTEYGVAPDGSSLAAAFVSGAAALILSDKAHHCDQIPASKLKQLILDRADSVPALGVGGKRLNVAEAIRNCGQ
jgi:hypothetical protein